MSESKAQVLTKDHVRFVRKDADKVVFRYVHGQAAMEVTNKAGAVLSLDCAFSYRGYGDKDYFGSGEREPRKAFCMIHTPSFTQEWITVASLLRAGDTLELEFIADSNGYARAAKSDGGPDLPAFDGLHMDYMRLVVRRGKAKLTFMLCSGVCPNNSARMFSWE